MIEHRADWKRAEQCAAHFRRVKGRNWLREPHSACPPSQPSIITPTHGRRLARARL
jgi:hypothetical protein